MKDKILTVVHQVDNLRGETLCGIKIAKPSELIDVKTGLKLKELPATLEDGRPRILEDINGTKFFGFEGNYIFNSKYAHDAFNLINCSICKQELIKQVYYCKNHGFLKPEEVTFDEKCAYCGCSV